MSRRKRTEKQEEKVEEKSVQESRETRIAAAREARKKAFEAKNSSKTKNDETRESFRKFFVKIRGKLNLDTEMEKVIWLHFKSAGFDKEEKFKEGIQHFGYKL